MTHVAKMYDSDGLTLSYMHGGNPLGVGTLAFGLYRLNLERVPIA